MPFFSQTNLVRKEPMEGFAGRFATGSTMTSVTWTVTAGAILPEHAHPHEQVAHVLEGEFVQLHLTFRDLVGVRLRWNWVA